MRLTQRQAEIVALMAEGHSDKLIARRLHLSPATVRTHVDRLFENNGVHNRAEAVAAWLRSATHGDRKADA